MPAHYQFDVTCRGLLDPQTSYVKDIKQIDRAVHKSLVEVLDREIGGGEGVRNPVEILAAAVEAIDRELGGGVLGVRWWVTPYHCYEMAPASSSAAGGSSVVIRQRFDFSASHRLHNPAMSEAENRERFGKCNNPAGHGHNYIVEPSVRVAISREGGSSRDGGAFTHADLQDVCAAVLIDRFDHKHLNVDTKEFSEGGGVLPTVENIARVFYEMLGPEISARASSATLVSLTVWETDRTSSTYPG